MQVDYLDLIGRFVDDGGQRTPEVFADVCQPDQAQSLARRALELSLTHTKQRE